MVRGAVRKQFAQGGYFLLPVGTGHLTQVVSLLTEPSASPYFNSSRRYSLMVELLPSVYKAPGFNSLNLKIIRKV